MPIINNALVNANRVRNNPARIVPNNIVNRPAMPLMPNMGTEILNPPPSLVTKLIELQAELHRHFPNNPNVVVAFNGHGGCLIGMENQAMQNLIRNAVPALPNHANPVIANNVRGYIG
jgi:hypothetical protein